MKETIRISALSLFLAFSIGAANLMRPAQEDTLITETQSWKLFCDARGHSLDDRSEETINEYLDTWVGSVDEEQAFNHLPAE